ncbi:MAG: 6-carboxytetrahydropterin synthase, partial [Flavobacterium sp.]|nr:6-carboxytetrahydropterin synthase [Flavobacterium sp.]
PLDHRNLNLDVPYFASVNPTAENIAIFIWQAIKNRLPLNLKLEVVLYETPRNFVTYSGE